MKFLMIDMDGTICDFFDPVNGEILMTEFPEGFFLNKQPIKSILNVIEDDYKDYNKIIFSNSPGPSFTDEKRQWLKQNGLGGLPQIFLEYPNVDKGQALYNFIVKNNIQPSDITVVDDDIRFLRNAEKLGVHCIHPMHLVAIYESKHNNG